MVVVGRVRRGAYFDSVTLMNVARQVLAFPKVDDAAAVMGTAANKKLLAASSLMIPEFEEAEETDLLVGIRAESGTVAEQALAAALDLLDGRKKGPTEEVFSPRSFEGALEVIPEANLALISVPGRHAGREARKALEMGLHVMLFSDNVPLDTEVDLKGLAQRKGLLLMGPDCGTAIIQGIPLGFANVIHRGPVGIVGASGTGIQEVSSIVSNEGSGVSHAIGTGGRDVGRDVGGMTFLAGISALAQDEQTRVLVLVSKPPDETVLERIADAVAEVKKPVVSIFLGAETGSPKLEGPHAWEAESLAEAAWLAVHIARGEDPELVKIHLAYLDNRIRMKARHEAVKRGADQRYIRGLMSGGTFAAEAQIILRKMVANLYSNVPVSGATRLARALESQFNTVVDLGADEFTVGKPHPMIDFSLRKRRILAEAEDPETAVILLDVVLGFGSHPEPESELGDVVQKACREVSVVCSVTGTDQDPQNRSRVERALIEAGALVMPSNAAASRMAGYIAQFVGER
jgi:succinyl-CoA synthetase alpha subunit